MSIPNEKCKLFELAKTGIFQGAVVVTYRDIIEYESTELDKVAVEYYSAIEVINLHNLPADVNSFEKPHIDCLFVNQLESIDPFSSLAYSLRSIIDINRSQGMHAYLSIDESYYAKYFNDNQAPFFQFCQSVSLEEICK